jgi:hypothetical protein
VRPGVRRLDFLTEFGVTDEAAQSGIGVDADEIEPVTHRIARDG